MVGLGIGLLTRGLRRQMKGFSLIMGALILLAFVALFSGIFAAAMNTKYACINGIMMESYGTGYWKQSSDYPKYCVNQEKVQ